MWDNLGIQICKAAISSAEKHASKSKMRYFCQLRIHLEGWIAELQRESSHAIEEKMAEMGKVLGFDDDQDLDARTRSQLSRLLKNSYDFTSQPSLQIAERIQVMTQAKELNSLQISAAMQKEAFAVFTAIELAGMPVESFLPPQRVSNVDIERIKHRIVGGEGQGSDKGVSEGEYHLVCLMPPLGLSKVEGIAPKTMDALYVVCLPVSYVITRQSP
jgi:hypothetical protein